MENKVEEYNKLYDDNLIKMYFSLDRNKYSADIKIIENILRKRFKLSANQTLWDSNIKEKLDRVVFESEIGDPRDKEIGEALGVINIVIIVLVLLGVLNSFIEVFELPLSVISFLFGSFLIIEFFRSGYTGETNARGYEIDKKKHPYMYSQLRWFNLIIGLFMYLLIILTI